MIQTAKEKCESCHIAVPSVEEKTLINFRGHRLCGWCIVKWNSLEKRAGESISWDNFMRDEKERNKKGEIQKAKTQGGVKLNKLAGGGIGRRRPTLKFATVERMPYYKGETVSI